MAIPKISARLEHVTRKPDRRKKEEEPKSWQDKLEPLTSERIAASREAAGLPPNPSLAHEDPLIQKIEPVLRQTTLRQTLENDIDRLKRKVLDQFLEIKHLELKLHWEAAARLEAEIRLHELQHPMQMKETR